MNSLSPKRRFHSLESEETVPFAFYIDKSEISSSVNELTFVADSSL